MAGSAGCAEVITTQPDPWLPGQGSVLAAFGWIVSRCVWSVRATLLHI
jgi:hypothetical protein